MSEFSDFSLSIVALILLKLFEKPFVAIFESYTISTTMHLNIVNRNIGEKKNPIIIYIS